MSKITISGVPFEIVDRYTEGHVLTANEAAALNQTFHENIGNNFRSKVKEKIVDGNIAEDEVAKLQTAITEAAADYQFGVRRVGGGGAVVRKDPVESEAFRLAKIKLGEALKAQGRKVRDVEPEKYEAAVAKLAESEDILKQARATVAARNKVGAVELESLGL